MCRIIAERGPLAGPLLMILGADVPREVPLPEERRDKPSLPRVADTHQKITALLCRSYVLDAQLLERNALRDAARRLQTLVLEDCTLKDGGVKILAEGLSRRLGGRDVCRLLCLSLTNNYIHADGAASLAQAVSVNTTLTELHLDWNPLGPVGVSHLADALRKNKALRSLNLEASDARDTGARSMGAALPLNSTLTTLILDTCNISHEGGTAIADGLRSNQTLASLSLSGNPLGDAGGVALAESLEAGNTSLTRLTVDSSELGLPFFMSIARAMRNGCQ
ncbi:hypothetical protein T484DRAFT_1809197 [Baffinella frigidus]|nr:hypothetical protein T484DRAFT_1809197 [Cryptophyta sp. CCMP2293]